MIKSHLRKLFYASPFARKCIGMASRLSGKTNSVATSHLDSYLDAGAIGPLQQPEALFLFALVKTTTPLTIVEFGFHHGHSAFNFLQAMRPDARLYSYDISSESAEIAENEFVNDPRFRFIHKSQADFASPDIDNRTIDFVFFDAAHAGEDLEYRDLRLTFRGLMLGAGPHFQAEYAQEKSEKN